jgi:hypothetical protein
MTKIPFHELFQASHNEKFLEPIQDLVKQIRAADISVYCLPSFAAPHIAALGRNGSCALLSPDGSEAPRGIVLNLAENNAIAYQAGVDDIVEALRTCLAHEWGHADAHQRRDEFDSEVLAWDFARKYSRLPQHDFDNLRRICLLREAPQLANSAVDTTPQFWKDFLKLGKQIGYQLAWAAVQVDIQKQGLQPWDVLRILQDDCKLPFEIAYPLSESEDIEYNLFLLAAHRSDHAELDRMLKPKPTPAKSIPPEQPLPPGYVG